MRLTLALLLALSATPALAAEPGPHPQEGAVTADEVEAYLQKKGLSLKDPRALDQLPNPTEVLRYERELKLTPEQRDKARAILKNVDQETQNAGKVLVQAEKELSRGDLDREQERSLLKRIEAIEGEVRWNQQSFGQMLKSVLSPGQAKQLDELEKAEAEKRR